MKRFKVKGTITYDFETEIDAEDYGSAFNKANDWAEQKNLPDESDIGSIVEENIESIEEEISND